MSPREQRISDAVREIVDYFKATPEKEVISKPSPVKWSKQEILGHLIDSAMHNIVRVAEVQFMDKPFQRPGYNQDNLVKAHQYQRADLSNLIAVFESLNQHMMFLISLQTENTLAFTIEFQGEVNSLSFWLEDYVSHLEHHARQIVTQRLQ